MEFAAAPEGGAAQVPNFFDAYPRFYETGNTGRGARLNARYECLIGNQTDLIRGRTIIDIGSHDGRWGFAALMAGAKHVIGIEPRKELVENAIETYAEYGIDPSRFSFHTGDALDVLRELAPKVDTVFLFGVLYHVHHHVELFRAIRETEATAVIIDTQLAPDAGEGNYANTISFWAEQVDRISQGANEAFPGAGVAIVGIPTRRAVLFLMRIFQLRNTEIDWAPYIAKWGERGLDDYAEGRRATFIGRRATA